MKIYLIIAWGIVAASHPISVVKAQWSDGPVERTGPWSPPVTIQAPSPKGSTSVILRDFPFLIHHANGNTQQDETVSQTMRLAYVPSKNLYWLGYPGAVLGIRSEPRFLVLDDCIISVAAEVNDRLSFARSTAQTTQPPDSDAGMQVIENDLHQKFESMSSSHPFDLIERLRLNVLGFAPFRGGQMSARGTPPAAITALTADDSTINISLLGYDGKIPATLTFDHDLRVLRSTLNGKQTYLDPSFQSPTLTAFTPAVGSTRDAVTLTGTNFTGATAVRFGKRDADDFTVVSPTQITAHPPGVSTGMTTNGVGGGGVGGLLRPFTDTISVVTPAGTATSAASFTVVVVPFDPFPPGGGEDQ